MPYKDLNKNKQYQKEYSEKNKERKKPAFFRSMLKLKYGITVQQYNTMLENQNSCCALCEKHTSVLERRLAVDHCHETGRIRGLLCMPCNTSLGQLGDNEESMYKIIDYLTQNTGV